MCRTAGAFIGSFLLARVDENKYFKVNMVAAAAVLVALFFVKGQIGILVMIGLLGAFCSSIFPIIYSAAMKAHPDKANEISGLMVTGVSGGAAIPPAMGILTDAVGSQAGSIIVIFVCAIYLVGCSFWLGRKSDA